MDIMVIIGWVMSIVLILFGIVFKEGTMVDGVQQASELVLSNLTGFINYPSLAITIGGTYAVLFVSFPLKTFLKTFKHIKILLFPKKYNPVEYIDQIVEFAKEARIKGLLSLEDKLNETKDEFLKNSLMLVVDSIEPEKVKILLETELEYLDERHAQDRAFYDKGASLAPAFGMIGTLIGLVLMLKDLTDPTTIGPAMGVALLTTLYGSILANVIFVPISNKLKIRHEEEYLCKMLICEGVQAIQAGENPNFISEKLTQLLPKVAVKASKGKKGADGADTGPDDAPSGDKKGKK